MTDAVEFFVPIEKLDFIGKYESLEDDFRSLAEKMNLRATDFLYRSLGYFIEEMGYSPTAAA